MEVDNASAQRIPSVHDGVGDESLTAALQPVQDFTVERIEILFDLRFAGIRAKIKRHITERRYAQILGDKFHFRVTADGPGHRLRQANIIRDHFAISEGANLPEGKPDLQSAKAARILRAIIDVIGGTLLKVIVRRV